MSIPIMAIGLLLLSKIGIIGGGAVDRYNGQVPPATKHYVNKVLHHKKILESVQL